MFKKPVTWIPLIWGVACGAAASGNFHTWTPFNDGSVPVSLYAEDALKAAACMLLSGPILTGYTQVLVITHISRNSLLPLSKSEQEFEIDMPSLLTYF